MTSLAFAPSLAVQDSHLTFHDWQDLNGLFPLAHFAVHINEGVEGDNIGGYAVVLHLMVRFQS